MATEIITKFTNEEDGMEAVVAKIPSGYSVALRDVDADEYVGFAIIFSTLDAAIAKAQTVVF